MTPEERRAYDAAYYQAHRDELLARNIAWNHQHWNGSMGEARANKRYYASHREEILARRKTKRAVILAEKQAAWLKRKQNRNL
jgi:hypothetical protein